MVWASRTIPECFFITDPSIDTGVVNITLCTVAPFWGDSPHEAQTPATKIIMIAFFISPSITCCTNHLFTLLRKDLDLFYYNFLLMGQNIIR